MGLGMVLAQLVMGLQDFRDPNSFKEARVDTFKVAYQFETEQKMPEHMTEVFDDKNYEKTAEDNGQTKSEKRNFKEVRNKDGVVEHRTVEKFSSHHNTNDPVTDLNTTSQKSAGIYMELTEEGKDWLRSGRIEPEVLDINDIRDYYNEVGENKFAGVLTFKDRKLEEMPFLEDESPYREIAVIVSAAVRKSGYSETKAPGFIEKEFKNLGDKYAIDYTTH